jgi:hypothetical protein
VKIQNPDYARWVAQDQSVFGHEHGQRGAHMDGWDLHVQSSEEMCHGDVFISVAGTGCGVSYQAQSVSQRKT